MADKYVSYDEESLRPGKYVRYDEFSVHPGKWSRPPGFSTPPKDVGWTEGQAPSSPVAFETGWGEIRVVSVRRISARGPEAQGASEDADE